jgi:Rrf2 family protein
MNSSTRFTVAVHTLTLLAMNEAEPVTSEALAGSVNTNPVVIRRVLGALRAAHLVTSQGGNGGGWRLAADPRAITLCAVYRAVEDEPLFALHHRPPNPHCPVGRNIQHALGGHFAAATRAMEAELARTTLADILGEVVALAG